MGAAIEAEVEAVADASSGASTPLAGAVGSLR